MPARVMVLPDAHTDDVLDYGFSFAGFGVGHSGSEFDNVASWTATVPDGVTLADEASLYEVVTLRLGPASAGTHRIIVAAVSDSGQEATIEADWTVSDPT